MQQPSNAPKATRTTDVMNAIRARIASRVLAADDRLPSIRSFAATMGVSPSTVVEAYDRLAAEGLIRARPGSGFYVSSAALPPLALARDQPQPADWMPTEALRRAFRGLARAEDAVLADYGATRGSLALRRMLMARFADEGLEVSPEQVLLTMSGTQAIDLICRFLLRPGDTVLVDDPCYFNFRALLRAHQVKLVSVPYTPSGPDVASFEAVLDAERPRLYITVSGLHNPTGATMSPQTAHRVLNAATACDLTIVEDDIFADFEPEPSARLAALDGLNRVIRIGSFSKTLSASLRCGFIAARADWIEQLVDLQVATGFGGPCAVATEIIASVLATGFYRKHVEELRRRLVRARRDVGEKLQRIGIEPWLMPRGGFQLWCRLPDGCDSADVARAALADNIVLAPGNVFSTTQSATGFMRFNVAQCRDPKLMPALQRAIGR